MKPVDLTQVKTIPLPQRKNKVAAEGFAQPPREGRSFVEFLHSLPRLLAGEDLGAVVAAVAAARRNRRPVILAMGAHVIKVGLSPVVIELMQRGVVTAVALNGSGAIHDSEIALVGATSEDVAAGLKDGSFGMARETGEFFNRAANRVLEEPGRGLGDLLGEGSGTPGRLRSREHSILAAGHRLGVPVTVHVAIGTDIVHMHPSANGAALGQSTFNDFRVLTAAVQGLSGGVYLNVGSAVLLPEVFLEGIHRGTKPWGGPARFRDRQHGHDRPLPRQREREVRRPPTVGQGGATPSSADTRSWCRSWPRRSSRSWHETGEFPTHSGGVSDYTAWLAAGLARQCRGPRLGAGLRRIDAGSDWGRLTAFPTHRTVPP